MNLRPGSQIPTNDHRSRYYDRSQHDEQTSNDPKYLKHLLALSYCSGDLSNTIRDEIKGAI